MVGSATPDSIGSIARGRRTAVSMLALAASMALAAPAMGQSLVVNPGFETGDTTGWTISGGKWTDVSQWPPAESTWAGAPDSYTITNAGEIDPYTQQPTVFGGNHALRLNDSFENFGVTALAQSVTNYAGNKLYYAWNAVLEPSHGPTAPRSSSR